MNGVLSAVGLWLAVSSAVAGEEPRKTDLFRAGEGGYAHYRIPGVVVTPAGTLLAYCEARKETKGDWGAIDLLLRRSVDGGSNWSEPVKVGDRPAGHVKNPVAAAKGLADGDAVTFNNPTAVVDRRAGVVHLLYCVEYARCFRVTSRDDGLTWSEPVELTAAFEELRPRYDWKVIATGPGHGIRLTSGRLLVPVWLSTGEGGHAHRPSCVSTIYSDDGGTTWHAGEIVVGHPTLTNPSETAAAELADGTVLLNIRSESARRRRATATNRDGASGWSEPRFDDALYEPVCMASLVAVGGGPEGKSRLIYAGPESRDRDRGSRKRERLTVRLSPDGGETWPAARVLEPGVAAYSDLAADAAGTAYCFYERSPDSGKEYVVDRLTLATFGVDWILAE